ncbi:hypothetical protein ABZX64_03860 [Streptomyces misionensis]|uniref:hypothetical protein n=1 Tax=Streptomyces misionensis TaxID=67331 RepID=UPI0033B493E1
MELYCTLSAEDEWPVSSVPLRSGHTIYIIYRNFVDGWGVDYLIHQLAWTEAETLAVIDGLSWGPAWPGRNCCPLPSSR